ncbi:MAG: DUF4331 family protein [Candidatus Hydrogenedentota bacterium]
MIDFIQKNHIRIAFLMPIVTVLSLGTISTIGCDDNIAAITTSRTQVEKLARPGIAEGLIISDTAFAAWHAATPAQETGTVALAEIAKTLGAINQALGQTAAYSALRVDSTARAFLPDVMRINTAIASGYANQVVNFDSGYTTLSTGGTAASGVGGTAQGAYGGGIARPVAGRLPEDDVIDITLLVLTDINRAGTGASGFNSDSIPYKPELNAITNDDTNAGIGHHFLMGEDAAEAASVFPFLSEPN